MAVSNRPRRDRFLRHQQNYLPDPVTFPTTGVLDSFNSGGNQDVDTRTGWRTSHFPADVTLRTDATPTYAVGTGLFNDNVWDLSCVDTEVWATLGSVYAAGTGLFLYARATTFVAPLNRYELYIDNTTSPDTWQLIKNVAGSAVNLGSSVLLNIVAGDSFGLEVIGSSIKSYHKPSAGVWALVNSATNSEISTAGYFAIEVDSTTTRIDEFGGGSLDPITKKGPIQVVRRTWAGR